ncbi:MAG: zinc ribbon domain-containing protein [Roseiflexaceae bacterium]|nr:zinc ribbon domain-containing protein [Roseiflexaceae bacterium]
MNDNLVCATCGETNPADARFCIGCGNTISAAATTGATVKLKGSGCPACGALNPDGATFCSACGRVAGEPRARPVLVAPPRMHPRVSAPPPFVSIQHRRRPHWHGPQAMPALMMLSILLLIGSVISHRAGVPLFLFFLLPFGLFRRRGLGATHQYAAAFWGLGLLFLILTKALWPGLLVLVALWLLFGR